MELSDVIESFYDESLEGLDLMEDGLLNLQPGPVESETINEIFRAAHSIKGGGGIFGFDEISEFMHGVETLLDQLRAGEREASNNLIELLLESVDCARHMFKDLRDKKSLQQDRIQSLQNLLNDALADSGATSSTVEKNDDSEGKASTTTTDDSANRWQITFKPHPGMLAKANDPLRMIRELAELGSIKSSVILDKLPPFSEIDPVECYLGWQIELVAETSKAEIEDVFAWVLDECDLIIKEPECPEEPEESETPAVKKESSSPGATSPSGGSASDSIRVSIDKIDDLINLVGELVITQSMLSRFDSGDSELDLEAHRNGLSQLNRNTRDLQESVLQIRMLPIRFCFKRFPRLVHDISNKLNKQVELKLTGEDTELDKTVLERINDPLVHLVRNSLDHGMESKEERLKNNKQETGTIELNAYHESGNIIIEVIDDGSGLNTEKIRERAIERGLIDADEELDDDHINNLIFQAGFSTVDAVSDLSGRGVGMDVVKRNINALGGDVWMESKYGIGTKVSIRLPLTLAILDGQILRVGKEIYIIPLNSIIETLQIEPNRINTLPGNAKVYRLRDQHIPIIRLDYAFNTDADAEDLENGLLIIVDSERQRYGIWVDELLDQQQVVIKSLVSNFKHVRGISGATILGDGRVALILDVTGIVSTYGRRLTKPSIAIA